MKNRRSIRLKEYDYSESGAYFVTVCTHNKECLFGEIADGEVILNDVGKIVAEEWLKSANIRNEIELDEFVVMPNHIHGIVLIRRGDRPVAPTSEPTSTSGPKPKSVGSFIAGFKSAATKRINQSHETPGQKLWQRNYYERVIRDENELSGVRQYILDNPVKWDTDEENPNVKSTQPR